MLLFERHVSRTLASDLDIHLKQLLAGIEIDPTGSVVLTRSPSDPRFSEPLSGLYWQLRDDRGQFLRSRSLWDATSICPPIIQDPARFINTKSPDPARLDCLLRNERSRWLSATASAGAGRCGSQPRARVGGCTRVRKGPCPRARRSLRSSWQSPHRFRSRSGCGRSTRCDAALPKSGGSQPSPSGKRARRGASACGGGQCPAWMRRSPGDRTVALPRG